MEFLLPVLEIASKIATPLSLAGVTATLFFYVFIKIIGLFPPGSINETLGFRLLRMGLLCGFVLALISMFVGVASYILVTLIGPYVMQNKIGALVTTKSYALAIKLAEPYVNNNPSDILAVHQLGTAYFATEDYVKGESLYLRTRNYVSDNACDPQAAGVISSLSVFEEFLNKIQDAYKNSITVFRCGGILMTDAFVFNHYSLKAKLGHNDVDVLPIGFNFSTAYWQSKYDLLLASFYINNDYTLTKRVSSHLLEAVCNDDRVKLVIQRRAGRYDFNPNPSLVHEFSYEIDAINKLDPSSIESILSAAKSNNCVRGDS